jgi:hypothetical protein
MIDISSNRVHRHWPVLRLHDSKMSRISFHSEPKQAFATSQPNVGDRLNRPQRGDTPSDRLWSPTGGLFRRELCEERAADPGRVVVFRVEIGHVMPPKQDQEACSRDSFRKLV